MWWIIFIFVLVLIAISMSENANNQESRKLKKEMQNKFIKDNDINTSIVYNYKNTLQDIDVDYIVDDVNKSIVIMDVKDDINLVPFDKIIGCDIVIDSDVAGRVGRTVVGGVLAGDAGAIVGAMTAKNYIMSYKVVIYCENLQKPQLPIVLINKKTSSKDKDYINAAEFASKVCASIKAIISMTTKSITTQAQKEITADISNTSEYSLKKIILLSVPRDKIKAIKDIRDVKGVSLVEAKSLVDNAPSVLYNNLTPFEAYRNAEQLRSFGLEIKIMDTAEDFN